MSHHFDTAVAREDPRLNLCDFYLFRGQLGTTVMAMTVNPDAGTKAPDTFHEEGLYAFRFDLNDDAHEELTFKVRFGQVGHAEGGGSEGGHVQTLEVRRATGRDAAEGMEGDVIASGTTGGIVAGDDGARIFAGLAPDLFAANRTGLDAFRAAVAAGQFAPELLDDGANYFENRNVTAIVIEMPTHLIGDPGATVRGWVTVSLCGHAPEVQVSRWGLPLITHAFITDEAVKDEYNRSHPSGDVPRFSQIVADALPPYTGLAGSTDDSVAYAQRVVERLFPITLPYVLDSAASFGFAGFNGRALTDNVENVMLSLQANTPIDQRATVPTTHILKEFPYFGAPHADPFAD
ncbi:MAG TPA: DUF4331 family protein [Solirubrobacteraceae bacterium]|nr:DUF4331 family protein [Solirubrobacteraceae bacterium]